MASPSGQGGRPPAVTKSELKDVLRESGSRVMTLGMVTEEVDASHQTVNKRLQELIEDGEVKTEKVGNATGYWLPEPETSPTSKPATSPPEEKGILTADGGMVQIRMPGWRWHAVHIVLLIFASWTGVFYTIWFANRWTGAFNTIFLANHSSIFLILTVISGLISLVPSFVLLYYSAEEAPGDEIHE